MIPTTRPRCTRCGRMLGYDEWGKIRYRLEGGAMAVELLCPAHTDEEFAGDWH